MKKIKILTYNIHKGFSFGNRRFVLDNIRESIRQVGADLVCLQEVIGAHQVYSSQLENWPDASQFEYLADESWPFFAYGKNAIYTEGHHGNAILSRFPILAWNNHDLSVNRFERRGLLHATIKDPADPVPLHVFCVHLNLRENDRHLQVNLILDYILEKLQPEDRLLLAGDFNDWRGTAGEVLESRLGLIEAFRSTKKFRHAQTFPSFFPLLALDRIYSRHLGCVESQVLRGGVWSELSDHLPLCAEFQFSENGDDR
jgi:endonuclease/exonuclease/phosphatase family metal-dependent hydrolase